MSMWNHYRDSIGAYAAGNNWSLMKDESALVNELGTESIVRNGRWFPIPGGAQIAQLKKGDIIQPNRQKSSLKVDVLRLVEVTAELPWLMEQHLIP